MQRAHHRLSNWLTHIWSNHAISGKLRLSFYAYITDMPRRQISTQQACHITVQPGDMVFYLEKTSNILYQPVHVAIAIDDINPSTGNSQLMLIHAVPGQGVITRPFKPHEHIYAAINPWKQCSHLDKKTQQRRTSQVIAMAKRFSPLEDNHIPINYSLDRLKKLESWQVKAISLDDPIQSYTKKLTHISHCHFFGHSKCPDYHTAELAGHHTITAKVSNLIHNHTSYRRKNFSKGMHCSQFVLMVFQMALKLTDSPYKPNSSEKTYLSRKQHQANKPGTAHPKADIYKGIYLNDESLPNFITKEAKTMSPAALLSCVLETPVPPEGGDGGPLRNLACSPQVLESFCRQMKTLCIPANNTQMQATDNLSFTQICIGRLELASICLSLVKLLRPRQYNRYLRKIYANFYRPVHSDELNRVQARKRRRDDTEGRARKRSALVYPPVVARR
ncbi:MAG: hypothetical protein VXY77_02200 [Pseudomonadota bacterium]|nr:hypothetical protein [Pseudomonadota bacterium]